MTTNTLWDLQAAIYAALAESFNLTAHLAAGIDSIHDHVPAAAALPYVVISAISARPLETQGHPGAEVIVCLRSYSKSRGMKESRTIMSEISKTLHQADIISDHIDIILCNEISADSFLDADGETRIGVQNFRVITEPTSP